MDSEFARLYQLLENSGILENTWLVLTSDHGELFERGIRGHNTPTLFRPVIHVPLLIFPPGGRNRQDVYENTSAVDLLPTLLHLAGRDPAEAPWAQGHVLPPFEPNAVGDQFAVESKTTQENQPMAEATLAMRRGRHKLIYYFGYPELAGEEGAVELFDLEADPGERVNLYAAERELGDRLLADLLARHREAERPFLG